MGKRTHLRGEKTSEIAEADARSLSYTNIEIPPVELVNEQNNTDDEVVVKYMSKLPGYLQGDESNHVLNVGVLDWSRLEKWKHCRAKRSRKRDTKMSCTILETVVPNASSHHHHHYHHHHHHKCKIDDQVHASSLVGKVKASRALQHHSARRLRCTLEPEFPSSSSRDSSLYKHETATSSYNKGRRSNSGVLPEMGNSGGSLGAKKESEKRAAGEIHFSQVATESANNKLDGEEKTVGDSNAVKQENHHQVSNDIVLLSGEPTTHKSSLDVDDNVKVTRERDSEDILDVVDLSCKMEERFGGRTSRAASRICDQEDESGKKRYPSPSKRFSFSFGRRLTFKEDSSSSADDTIIIINKSDSMRFDGPSQSGVSPLLLQEDTWRRTRALFQLTTRNGNPLFQFVVNDDDDNLNNSSRSILGARMKNSAAASSFKDDSVQHCTFYSVASEVVKKKRSWLHKEKQQQKRGLVYNVIGQMRLCNSSIREAVLVDDTERVKEVAAVVIKKKTAQENGETIVIIPGGVHSFPEKGAPTPLVSRWRSGGCCDCGGWDLGCKIHVYLSNKTLLLHDDLDFKLFAQEESHQDTGPVLAMTELKTGIYRVEFDTFLSHLQAFFVCVTVITCASDEETVSMTTGKSSSPFAPPLSPVGRV